MIEKKLIELSKSNIYPFHMPGHKRQGMEMINPYDIDITEIDGFDNLHKAEDIIKDAQEEAARLYGAKKSYFLVNGSTCGLLAAISAAAPKGAKVIVARNSHKSVYHGLYLRELVPVYVYPEIEPEGIQGEITVAAIREKLEQNPDAAAVVITSPTYDGVVSDIAAISELVHSYGIPLIVDEAHGAHFGFEERLPENAIKQGADLVILSLHKTLPAFTQTALLNVCSDRVDVKKIEKFLGIYETSSPSYVFMAGIERCIRLISEKGKTLFKEYMDRLEDFYRQVEKLSNLNVVYGRKNYDSTKIIIFTNNCSIDGPMLYSILLKEYELQLEMCAGNYAMAISSVMDTKEGLDRLAAALLEIDRSLEKSDKMQMNSGAVYKEQSCVMEIHQVDDMEEELVSLENAVNQISGDYVFVYPPGIPIVVPGERITEELVDSFNRLKSQGITLNGLTEEGLIKIVNPS